MKRILIDLTDLQQWHGSFGGIQRVVYGITKELFLDKTKNVVYVRFDNQKNCFIETSFELLFQRIEKIPEQKAVEVRDSNYDQSKQGSHLWLRNNRITNKLYKSLKTNRANNNQESNRVNILKDDTFIILGKPWDNLNIQEYLTSEKKHTDFKLVQIVYDMVISLYPHLQNPVLVTPYNKHMEGVVRSSDLLLCISKSTQQDIKKFCHLKNIKIPKTAVIRLGDSLQGRTNTTKFDKPDKRIQKDFIACIGTIEIRKNHALLYYTYKLAQERNIKLPQLLLVGGRGWLSGDIQYMIDNDPTIKKRIMILDNIDDKGLNWIYKNCMFTVYPSMYEGWGLPVAESLSVGKVCVCSHSSSIPEIAGNLVDYFSPYDAQECLDVLIGMMSKKVRIAKETIIAKKYKKTYWHDTFLQIIKQMEQLNAKSNK